ncbi:MAG: hypothetical protein JSR73_15615 [Proteobacteria bacterium]|nr:hypothetical protein [Pseudomonadota bacterium]
MNDKPLAADGLDRRLARLMSTLDAAPGFEARLAARLAAERRIPDAAAREHAREAAIRARAAEVERLRRALRARLVLMAATAAGAAGPVWLVARLLADGLAALPASAAPWLALASFAALAAWIGTLHLRLERGEPVLAA